MNTANLPRAAVSIRKVIDKVHLTGITVTVAPHTDLALNNVQERCNLVSNRISLKTGLENEIRVTGC
jgi:ABC-type ATPase involved in cell division